MTTSLIRDSALCPGDLANPVGNWGDECFGGAGVRPLRQAGEGPGNIDAGVVVDDLDEHLEEYISAKLAGFVGKRSRPLFLIFPQCLDKALEEES